MGNGSARGSLWYSSINLLPEDWIMPARSGPVGPLSRHSPVRVAVSLAALLVLASLAAVSLEGSRGTMVPTSLAELAVFLGGRRAVEPRLTGGFAHVPCNPAPQTIRIMAEPRCSPISRREL